MVDEYNLVDAFRRIEDELIASMIRNLKRHRAEEGKEGLNWAMWQALQLEALARYSRANRKKYGGRFRELNGQIEALIRQAKDAGGMEQEAQILRAVKNGFPGVRRGGDSLSGEFFQLNKEKLEALIAATTHDMKKAETAVLRMANDQYRKIIFNAQVYANAGAGTYEKAVDMAAKDFLAVGLNCIEYKNGARHTISDYADMAIRTASKRAYLAGEGEKRKEYGITTVIVNKRGNPCPKCLPFCGKVLIDDVWSGGSREDGNYPLMSMAIAYGLYHPRCKDVHTTYFPGISTADDTWTEEELETIRKKNKAEAGQQYAKRQEEKYRRLAKYSLDSENKKKYGLRAPEWVGKTGKSGGCWDISKTRSHFIDRLRNDKHASLHKDKMALYSEFTELIEDGALGVPFTYDSGLDAVKFNLNAPYIEEYDMDYVFAHEISHRMDELEYHSWENKKFLQAIETCRQKVYSNEEEIQEWFEDGGKYEYDFAMSDIVDALSRGDIVVQIGHGKEYWEKEASFEPMEIFANLSSMDVLGKVREDIFKELFDAYYEVVN